MELIDIITSVLLYGGGIIVVYILIAYLFAKSKAVENPIISHNRNVEPTYSLVKKSNSVNYDQAVQRKSSSQNQPIIIYVDKNRNKELKIVRKSTYDDREKSTDETRRDFQRKTNGQNGSRYTIVNEQNEKNKKPHVINFYL